MIYSRTGHSAISSHCAKHSLAWNGPAPRAKLRLDRAQLKPDREILGVALNDGDKAYPFKELRKHGQTRFEDEFEGRMLTIEWLPDDKTARALNENGEQIPGVLAYWFVWYAFHPDTLIFKANAR